MIETRRLTVEGLTTSVLVGGSGKPGEAVVFVHGNPDSASDWMPLMTRVAEFATVVAPDLPGFGAADPRRDGDYTIYSYARFLDGVIRQLGFEALNFDVVQIGSLYKGSPVMTETMMATIHEVAPGARAVRLTAPPVAGGVLLGMEQAGIDYAPLRNALIEEAKEVIE